MATEPGIGLVVGGYRIDAVAGRGGMGVVYRATQLALDRTVALKLLAPSLADDEAFRDRFQRESKLLASIDHPNVVTVHEAGEHDGRLFIAMRYVVGTDLGAVLEHEGALDPERATELIRQVAAALDAAHARGLIHRDVKPANVLIEVRDGREHAFLSDFGLTRVVGSTAGGLTATGQFVGTLDYIAPEQVMGGPVDARVDVYSLGCVLYTVLAGRVPFERDTEVAKIFAHVNARPPPLSEYTPQLPPGLESVVERAMEKQPDDRFPSAGDLARAAVAATAGAEPRAAGRTAAGAEAAASRRVGRGALILAAAAATGAVALALVLLAGGGTEQEDPAPTGGGGGDALSAELRPQFIPVSGGPTTVAVGAGAAWVANRRSGTVTPIDPRTGERGEPVFVGRRPGGIAVAGRTVLVMVEDGRALARLDATTREVPGSTVPGEYLSGGDLVSGEGGVWAAMSSGEIGEVDPGSGSVLHTVAIPDPGSDGRLTVGGGAVWVIASRPDRSFIVPVDTRSYEAQQRIDLGRGSIAAGLTFAEGALWVVDVGRNILLRVDPADGRVERSARAEETGLSTDDLAAGGGALWVATADPDRMLRFDPEDGTLAGPLTQLRRSADSELAVGLGSAFLTDPERDTVVRFAY